MPSLIEPLILYVFLPGILCLGSSHLIGYSGPLSLLSRMLNLLGAVLIGSFFCILSVGMFWTQAGGLPVGELILTVLLCLLLLAIGLICIIGSGFQWRTFCRGKPFDIRKKRYRFEGVEAVKLSSSGKSLLKRRRLLLLDPETQQYLSQGINWLVYKRLSQVDQNMFPIAELERRGETELCRSIVLIGQHTNQSMKII